METLLKKTELIEEKETRNVSETEKYGRKIAVRLEDGDVVGLTGNLGAGKTHLIKGIAAEFSVDDSEVTSPTFNIMREYHGGPFVLYHFDFYRIEKTEELDSIGFRDYIAEEDAVCLIEWPEKEPAVFDVYTYIIKIEHLGGDQRKISVFKRR